MERSKRKWKWVETAFYLDEPYKENGIEEALKDEYVRKNLFSTVLLLQRIKNK